MAFWGGRGRGRGRGYQSFTAIHEPFVLFPENIALPDRKAVSVDEDFVRWNMKLTNYFENSPYFVEESASKVSQPQDIERYSDAIKPRNKAKRESLSDYMKLQPGYFPLELVHGVSTRPQKKVKWNVSLDQCFDKIEKRAKTQFKERIEGKNNEEEEEEEEPDDGKEEEEDSSSGGDYEQNEDFDDDDDDFNDADDGDDEPFY